MASTGPQSSPVHEHEHIEHHAHYPSALSRGPLFEWKFNIGHVLQALALAGAAVGIWYGLIGDIDGNSYQIESNRKAIIEIRESNSRMMSILQTQGDRREERLMGHVTEIKESVNWLVRREASVHEK